MSGAATKVTHRKIRKALGPDLADTVVFTEARMQIVMGIVRRGFWGRMKWLFLGR